MPVQLSACVCVCVSVSSVVVLQWRRERLSPSLGSSTMQMSPIHNSQQHSHTTQHSITSPSSHSPVLSTFMPSFLSISGQCKSFHFFIPLFSCLCPILYLLVFLSVLYLAEQGPNLHSLWPLQERDREKEGNSFGLLDGTEG